MTKLYLMMNCTEKSTYILLHIRTHLFTEVWKYKHRYFWSELHRKNLSSNYNFKHFLNIQNIASPSIDISITQMCYLFLNIYIQFKYIPNNTYLTFGFFFSSKTKQASLKKKKKRVRIQIVLYECAFARASSVSWMFDKV